jgi:hypothetical protein
VAAFVTGLASSGASEELRRAIAAIAAAKGQVPLWLPSRRPADLPRRDNTHAPQAVVS